MSPVSQSAEFGVLSAESPTCDTETCACADETTQQTAVSTQPSGKQYWRSVEDLADTPELREFMHREFPAGASEMLDSNDRRQFLKIMGASMALAGAGLAGCRRWPEEKIAPYAYRPPGHNPGSTDQFATCMDIGGVASALLVTSYDYRPIKVDGNPEHPINQGASDAFAQASILDLYDPDRSRSVMHKGAASDWAAFTAWAKEFKSANANAGHGLAILSEATSSPSVAAMKKRLLATYPKVAWHEYEPLNNDNVVKGAALAFGAPHRAHYSFDKASVIVSLDADFLSSASAGPAAIKWMRDFAKSRRAEDHKTMSRLYMFESAVSLTGANADHRVAMHSGEVPTVASLLGLAMAASLEDAFTRGLAAINDQTLRETLEHLVADLKSSRGKSIVLAGPQQPAEVHYLAHLLNETLGNVGHTVTYTAMSDAVEHVESIKSLAANISAGQVSTLVILGGNPAYNAPADLKFADLLKSVATTIHLSDYVDETSAVAATTWHINRAHYLEAWGDGRAYDGTISIAQPLIDPLFSGKSAIEVLAALTGDEKQSGREIVQRTIREMGSGMGFDAFWNKALHDGLIAGTAAATVSPTVQAQHLQTHVKAITDRRDASSAESLEVVFLPDASVLDGRFANNGWLQELPDPITKLTWDNAALMSPAAAKSRGLKSGSMVTLGVNGRELQAAVMVVPGQHFGSIGIALGYGRSMAGRISADAGFNAFAIRSSDSMGFAGGATVAATGESYLLSTTQDHHAPDTVGGKGTQERLPTLFREANLAEYQEDPKFAAHRTHVVHRLSLFEESHSFHHEGQGSISYAWGMSIDLNACTGCNACVIACQAENNIPIVGKEQVRRNREMHWIRIDRYFKGTDEEHPDGFMLAPVTCMHCENAPCEQVCPVAATVHDDSGLNVMVYNRCVGTRYCSNNCPYKVRRFNYFDYWRREPHREQPGMLMQVDPDYYTKGQAKADPLRQLQFNPEVTVRMRGIMEKCTFCVQRISKARKEVKNEWVKARNLNPDAAVDARVPIPDGMITPACAQACPAQAIVFGDLRDPNSRVSNLNKHPRTYQMLEELNTKPRTQYMAKIRNPAFGGTPVDSHSHG